jgi:hypothetical protein
MKQNLFPFLVSKRHEKQSTLIPLYLCISDTHTQCCFVLFIIDQHLTLNEEGTRQSLTSMLQQHNWFISRWKDRSSSDNFEIINHVPSSGFSLVIRAAITWPHGCGFCRGLSKSIDESPHGDSPYNWRISLMRLNGRPIAICNHRPNALCIFNKHSSYVRHPIVLSIWIWAKETSLINSVDPSWKLSLLRGP